MSTEKQLICFKICDSVATHLLVLSTKWFLYTVEPSIPTTSVLPRKMFKLPSKMCRKTYRLSSLLRTSDQRRKGQIKFLLLYSTAPKCN